MKNVDNRSDMTKFKDSIVWLIGNMEPETKAEVLADYIDFCKFVLMNKPWLTVSNSEFVTAISIAREELKNA